MKILVCGLPGSGKTWLSERLAEYLDNCAWYNADVVRRSANDWDFSMEENPMSLKGIFLDIQIIFHWQDRP